VREKKERGKDPHKQVQPKTAGGKCSQTSIRVIVRYHIKTKNFTNAITEEGKQKRLGNPCGQKDRSQSERRRKGTGGNGPLNSLRKIEKGKKKKKTSREAADSPHKGRNRAK